MNPHVKLAPVTQSEISPAEWQARVDLAATYRLIAHYGWGDVIYNHSSMRVPGEERKFLIKRHELLYTEVTPSNLVKVSMDDDLDESAGVNRPGFTLHGGVLSARPDVNCAVEDAFEKVWLGRDSYLDRIPGFLEFHLLRGPEAEDHTLYSSHTVWQSKGAFEAWTKSQEFRAAHARAGNETTGPLYLEHPKFEGFEVRQTITRKAASA